MIKANFTITTDKAKLDLAMIHDFLSNESYWSKGIPFEKVKNAIDHSLNFGLFHLDHQVGFARVISDFSTIAYLGDVFILSDYRGQGLSKWLIEQVMNYPDLQGLRRWILLTRDAHGLYKQFGWKSIAHPEKFMEIHDPNIYESLSENKIS